MRISTLSSFDIMPEPAREFLSRRFAELGGLALLAGVGAVSLSLATWSVRDPSWNHAASGTVHNLAGPAGAVVADIVMQMVGIAVVALLPPVFCWGLTLLSRRRLDHARLRLALLVAGGCGATALAASLPATDRWPLPTGLGGIVGDGILSLPRRLLGHSEPVMTVLALVFAGIAILALTAASGFGLKPAPGEEDDDIADAYDWVPVPKPRRQPFDDDAEGEPGVGLVSLGAAIHAGLSARSTVARLFRGAAPAEPTGRPSWLDGDRSTPETPVSGGARLEPSFEPPSRPREERGRR